MSGTKLLVFVIKVSISYEFSVCTCSGKLFWLKCSLFEYNKYHTKLMDSISVRAPARGINALERHQDMVLFVVIITCSIK
jgi:hypothetical protein